jgi:hypothetical protein
MTIRRCQFGIQRWEIHVQLIGRMYEAIAFAVLETVTNTAAIAADGPSETEEAAFQAMIKKIEKHLGLTVGPCR